MSGTFAPQFVHGVYIPSALLIVGTAIVKKGMASLRRRHRRSSRWLEEARKVLKPDAFQEFPLTEKTVLSHNTAIYRFALPRTTDILGLPIGQHISIAATLPGQPRKSSAPTRPSRPTRTAATSTCSSRPTRPGNISKHVAGLSVGQTIKVKGPKGAMVYTPNLVRHFGMIAGGTGITPMLQIIKASTAAALRATRPRRTWTPSPQRTPASASHYVLNNPPEGWTGGVGFVTADMIKSKLPAPAKDVKILVCGPPPMVSAMKKAAESLATTRARPVSKLEDQVFCF
ncbi:putative NADH-cytochrome b5 reductase protein [Botryosphaeria dothidea]|uniref:NADH-cytochrome b5 reductase protein n=1 Tax=Botryosphaeria dothidea TaxID=55169 RepID=A0A8H4IRC8_9PEZI|nr:putative NADH-cytochrome b5 reductase protein [Botryosphaeria dothidea]